MSTNSLLKIRRTSWLRRIGGLLAVLLAGLQMSPAEVPGVLNYQGRIAVDGTNFSGSGQFKFALVNANGTETFWSNDGSSTAGSPPAAAVTLPVTRGLYQLLLGDTSLANMTAVPHGVFHHPDVRLRIWFNDGARGFQHLLPDQRLAPAGYAMKAASAERVEKMELSGILTAPARWVAAWGTNTDGALNVPAGLINVVQAAAGDGFSLALKSDGTLSAWGGNASGQTSIPSAAASGIKAIAAGTAHSLAVKTDGTVLAWGANGNGQCDVPPSLSGVIQVAAGGSHSMARRGDGTVVVWGDNAFGQTNVPGSLSHVTAIAAGSDHCLALTSAGNVTAWGRNDAGQCDIPSDLGSVSAIAAGALHSLALKAGTSVAAWGWNLGGQCNVPAGLSGVTAIDGGYAHSAAVKGDGSVIAWGDSAHGETSVPSSLGGVIAVSSQGTHTLALRAPLVQARLARLDEANVFTEKTGLGRVPAINRLEVEGQASKSTAGNWAANSDRRIKTDIQPVTGALETLGRLKPVTFHYTPEYLAQHPGIENVPYFNVIAQEFREVFPDAVKFSGERMPDGSDILQVDTYPATITSLAAIRELHTLVKQRDTEIAELKARLARLEEITSRRDPETPLPK
ncbi:MAG: tail fiber domain-containing protein [Verrucomicrobiota bacterium]